MKWKLTHVAALGALPAAACFLAAAAPAPAGNASPQLAALDNLSPGNWEVRYRPDNTRDSVCVRTGRELIQIRHGPLNCGQFVVEATADRATIHYTCRGHGYGRTQLRRENNRLVQIESQGIFDGSPFQFSAEARRVGSCAR
ncbi:MAG: DUF3617 domain-containing protein [Novosphingobium sp.]